MTPEEAARVEADRRYPYPGRNETRPMREGFVAGAEWAWKNPPADIKGLLEAAESVVSALTYAASRMDDYEANLSIAHERLLAAAAALPGGTDA